MTKKNRYVAAFAAILTGCLMFSNVHAEAPFSFASTPGKLPKNVLPVDYTIHVMPDIATSTFRATATIRIDVLSATSDIVLNALELDIDSAALTDERKATQVLLPQLDKDQQILRFTLPKPAAPGRYELALTYRGVINREAQGLYYDKYSTLAGEKTLLSTQMEPTDARRLFPCWDEPAYRAGFNLSVDIPANFKAFSNTPVAKQEILASGMQRIAFDPTPKMPSYLVVLVMGELEYVASVQDGTQIGIVTTEGKQESGAYALKSSKDILHFYNDYFGVRYPLRKLDQIAVPGGFGGAMENWGGIVYNESRLLYDTQKSPDSTKQRIFSITAHEMAHQWFGDLVTMAWWDNLWLNEGFASWMAAKTTDHFNPDWKVWLEANEDREKAMNLDSRKSTHPVQQRVDTESEANDAFDDITYLKGQAFLRMLETYLGEDTFRKGIRMYMAKHQYSNTTTADLWNALALAAGKPVSKIASDWTTQPGFPVVKVDAVCKGKRTRITLTQEQFKLDDASPGDRLWSIPVQIGSIGGGKEYVLLQERSRTFTRPGCNDALMVDPDGVGFYRVEYAAPLFDALQAKLLQMPDSARLKFVSDAWAMVAAERLPLSSYMKLLGRLGAEPRLAVWDKITGDLQALDGLSFGEPFRPGLHKFAVDLMTPAFKKLGWDEKPGESVENRELRAQLILALAGYGDQAVIAQGRARFHQFIGNPDNAMPASLIGPVLFIAGRYADQADYDALKQLAEKAQGSEEKFRYYRALSTALDPKLAAQALQLALAPGLSPLVTNRIVAEVAGIPSRIVSNVFSNDNLGLAWEFAKEHGDALVKPQTLMNRNQYFPKIVGQTADASYAADMEAYVKAHLPAEALTEAQRTGDGIRIRAKLKARLKPELAAIFK